MRTPNKRLFVTAAIAVAAAGGVFAQPKLAETDARTQLVEQIAKVRAEGGPTPADDQYRLLLLVGAAPLRRHARQARPGRRLPLRRKRDDPLQPGKGEPVVLRRSDRGHDQDRRLRAVCPQPRVHSLLSEPRPLADWLLANTPPDRLRYEESDEGALALYDRVYRELEEEDEARASILSPEVPITLPTYEPNPFASAATESSYHIDVSFDVTKYGLAERIEILDTSKGAHRAEERELIRLIARTRFRPRFVDGKLADAAPVVVRYHLGGR
jgi:hypothetical protein